MIDQNDFKSIVPVHHLNPPPFLCHFFLTITFSIVGKDWYQCQICAELSRLQHQRVGPWMHLVLLWKRSVFREGGIILSQLRREGRGGMLGKGRGVQVRREGTRADWSQESVLVIKTDKRSSVPVAEKLSDCRSHETSDCLRIVDPP